MRRHLRPTLVRGRGRPAKQLETERERGGARILSLRMFAVGAIPTSLETASSKERLGRLLLVGRNAVRNQFGCFFAKYDVNRFIKASGPECRANNRLIELPARSKPTWHVDCD